MSDKTNEISFDEKAQINSPATACRLNESCNEAENLTQVVQAFPHDKKASRLRNVVVALCLATLVVLGVLVCIYTYVTQFVLPTIVIDAPDAVEQELAAPQIFTEPEIGPRQTVFNLTARSTLEIFPKGIFPDKSQRFFEFLLPDSFLAGGDPRLQRVEAWLSNVNIKSMRFTMTNGNQTFTTPTFGLPSDAIGNLTTASFKVQKFTNTT